MKRYRDWDVLEQIPEGWEIDNSAGSPLPSSVFITNGKSVLNGQKRAILKCLSVPVPKEVFCTAKQVPEKEDNVSTEQEPLMFPAKTVNALARLRFQEQLLKEILFDMTVCELEGWDKKEYINELIVLLSGYPKDAPINSNQH